MILDCEDKGQKFHTTQESQTRHEWYYTTCQAKKNGHKLSSEAGFYTLPWNPAFVDLFSRGYMSRLLIKRINEQIANSDVFFISLGKFKFCIVDKIDYERINAFKWKAQKSASCWYAVRNVLANGKYVQIKMHREIMKAPAGYDVHHINKNSLDNRRRNLQVVTRDQHKILHTTGRP